MENPRSKNGALRRKNRARFKALGLPCHLCGKSIHYNEPSDYKHPLSLVIDEIIPVSRYQLGGYNSPREAAEDWSNLAPAHWCCNAAKGNKINPTLRDNKPKVNYSDGNW